jgi:DNA-binding NarL/FixJ family response regulator
VIAIDDAGEPLLSTGLKGVAAPGQQTGQRVSIVLIDRRPLTRRCLTRWLQDGMPNSHIVSVGSPADLLNGGGSPIEPHIIIFSIGAAKVGDPDVFGKITLLRRHLGFIPLILLSDRDDVDNIVAAIEYGVRGYVPTSLEPSEAAAALQCVMAGGTFVPVSAIIKFAKQRPRSPQADEHESNSIQQLSKRENEVLTRLRQGKPNKIIAHELGISESTVKVFVQRIMMKLRATNRTELAGRTRGRADLG